MATKKMPLPEATVTATNKNKTTVVNIPQRVRCGGYIQLVEGVTDDEIRVSPTPLMPDGLTAWILVYHPRAVALWREKKYILRYYQHSCGLRFFFADDLKKLTDATAGGAK